MVCGGGGVGKTTIAASLAVSAARVRKRVLVVTIDPAKRLLQAFGFKDALLSEGGPPLALSSDVKASLGLPESAHLSVAMLNPKYVLEQIIAQTLNQAQADKLKKTLLYGELSQMIYGLQEYTAYEWVTRMIDTNEFDLIVLDTPPAFHAKDFFNAPEKIRRLMESRVFQIFLPKKASWFTKTLSFGWMEKLLGAKVFQESKIFFETFVALRERILERCDLLSQFFVKQEVSVVVVTTTERTAGLETEGLVQFLKEKRIPLESLVINQVEEKSEARSEEDQTFDQTMTPQVLEKLNKLRAHQNAKADRALEAVSKLKSGYPGTECRIVPTSLSSDGIEIIKNNSLKLS